MLPVNGSICYVITKEGKFRKGFFFLLEDDRRTVVNFTYDSQFNSIVIEEEVKEVLYP